MKKALAIIGAILLVATPALAHRLDEYLQATTLLVSRDRLRVEMRLAPGVKVADAVIDGIDTNRDGVISDAEAKEYGRKVIRDVSLRLDGEYVELRLASWRSNSVAELKEGVGEIQLAFEADLPGGSMHRLVFENRHRRAIGAYLVNSLVPQERDIRITSQNRNYEQSVYGMTWEQNQRDGRSMSFDTLLRRALLLALVVVALVHLVATLRRRDALRSPWLTAVTKVTKRG